MENLVAMANQGYINSGVKIALTLHCIERYGPGEEANTNTMLTAFTTYKGTVPRLLGGADLAVLITSDLAGAAGMAFTGNLAATVGVVNKGAAEAGLGFGHETAHMFGAGHDKAQMEKDGGYPVEPYAMGYNLPGSIYHTILS